MKKRSLFLKFFSLFLCSVFLFVPFSSAEEKRTICIVYSYSKDSPWTNDFSNALETHISNIEQYEVKKFYIESPDVITAKQKADLCLTIKKDIMKLSPFLVISCDEDAFNHVAKKFLDSNIFIIAAGLNGDPLDYDLAHDNIIAVFEQESISGSISFAKELFPRIRKIAVLSDSSATSLQTMDLFAKKEHPLKIVAYRLIRSFSVWKNRIKRYSLDADAIFINRYHHIIDGETNKKVPPEEVLKWTIENCSVPTIASFDYDIEKGVLCGKVHSGYSIGFETAKLADQVLNDVLPSKLSSIIVARTVKMLNLNTADKLNLSLDETILSEIDKVIK